MIKLMQTSFLQAFQCLGDKCEDTCCKGWGMQVDGLTYAKYCQSAPELLDAVVSGEAEHVMRRDPQTDYCVKFDNGWCGIHKKYGEQFLGDACNFFPRITRKLNDTILQTASMSCPEIVRLVLHTDHAFDYNSTETERLPEMLKNYCPEQLSAEDTLKTHMAFITACEDETATAEHILCRIHAVTDSLKLLDIATWPSAAAFYLKNADTRLPTPQPNPSDTFNLFYALTGLISATNKANRPRLEKVVGDIQQALGLSLSIELGKPLAVSEHSVANVQKMNALWQQHSASLQPSLRRWLQAQLSIAFFPFGGFGDNASNRIAIIGVRLATLKLALVADLTLNQKVTEESFTRIVQSLSRFMDHLADPTFSLKIYGETEWLKLQRLRGLLGDY